MTAPCDPRAVIRYLWGDKVTPVMRVRVEAALRQCELAHLVKSNGSPNGSPAPRRDSSPPPSR